MALKDQQLRILERLDKLISGARGQTTSDDMDRPPIVSLAIADQASPSMDTPQALIDALQEALVHLGPFKVGTRPNFIQVYLT